MSQEKEQKELILRAANGDSDSLNNILNEFSPTVGAIAHSYSSRFKINGYDYDDLVQVGLLAVNDAVSKFDSTKNGDFSVFAKVCIHNRIKDAIKESQRVRNTINNEAIQYGDIDENTISGSYNLEHEFLVKEQLLSVYSNIDVKLTPYEKSVLDLYIDGLTYSEIAARVKRTTRSVESALRRIRKKLV